MTTIGADTDLEVLADDCVYTESPRWRDGTLWFSDIGAGEVCRVVGDGPKEVVLSSIPTPSGLGWTRTGELIVVSIHEAAIYRVGADGVPRVLCGPERHGTRGSNDMATAGSRSYVTCSGRDYQMGDDNAALAQAVGRILLIDHDTGACSTVAADLKMPNGVGIAPDGRTLFVNELYAMRVLAFPIRPDGSLLAPRTFAQLDYIIDGLALDAEGGVWVGGGGRFQRLDAHGRMAEAVEVPGWSCIAPMLGGADGRSLFMAVSQMESPDAIFDGRAKARILRTRVAVPAAAEADFQ